jgi:hypothetical protein
VRRDRNCLLLRVRIARRVRDAGEAKYLVGHVLQRRGQRLRVGGSGEPAAKRDRRGRGDQASAYPTA